MLKLKLTNEKIRIKQCEILSDNFHNICGFKENKMKNVKFFFVTNKNI